MTITWGTHAFYCTICGQMHESSACPRPESLGAVPHRCPVCQGQGIVSRPPWIAGDQETWISGGTELYECQACGGHGIVWR